jgi:hypothetical protein
MAFLQKRIIVERCNEEIAKNDNYNSHPYAGISQIRFIGLDFSSQRIFNGLKYALR